MADRQASTGLRILLQNRPDVYQRPGGDTVQTEQTLAFLRREGHDARLSLELSPDLSAVDVVHLFNLTTPLETYIQARNAVDTTIPYCLSPVYWDLEEVIPWHGYSFPQSAIYLGLHPKLLRTAKRAPCLRRLAASAFRRAAGRSPG